MNGVQIVIAPNMNADGKPVLILGFHSEWFSQTVTLPYQGADDTYKLADTIHSALRDASTQIEKYNEERRGE